MAFESNIFIIHALGDAVSPTIIGWCSDRWGLQRTLLITPAALALAAFFAFCCGRLLRLIWRGWRGWRGVVS